MVGVMHGKGAFPCVGEHSHRHFVRGGRDWIDWMAFISMVLTFFHCVFGPTFGHQRRKRGNLATRQIGCDMDVEWTQTPANLTAARPPDRGFFFHGVFKPTSGILHPFFGREGAESCSSKLAVIDVLAGSPGGRTTRAL